jgi:thioredoxin 1
MENINRQKYDELVKNKSSFVVMATASWCSPCRTLKPLFEKLAAEYAGKPAFYFLDTDEEGELAGDLVISAIPTIIFMKKGSYLDIELGVASESKIRSHIKDMLS